MKLDIVLLEFYVVERLTSSFLVDELNEIAFAVVLAISGSLEIVCPFKLRCFIG